MKTLKRHCAPMTVGVLLITACANKEGSVNILTDSSSPTYINTDDKANLRSLARHSPKAEQLDTLLQDSTTVYDCYRWARLYKGATEVLDENGEPLELNIYITLNDSPTEDYTGGMAIFSPYETIEAHVRGHAEGNHITIYYVENPQNTTEDLFNDGDKLVLFDLEDGEYHASWYAAMHRFVNENTIIIIEDYNVAD